jgi:Zn-dependent protease
MAWQDRPYYRDSSGVARNPLMWLLTGSVPLFTAFGIRVRAHASMVIFIVIGLLLGIQQGMGWREKLASMVVLFVLVLMHEFGHCFTARWVGGDAEDILMHPLGGLAMAHPPKRPLPTFLTVAGGPAVNLLVCILCGLVMWRVFGWLPWGGTLHVGTRSPWLMQAAIYSYWIYYISLALLLFNLLPIFPLDGGQMLQTALWPWLGWFKSTVISCVIGMVGGGLMAIIAVVSGSMMLLMVSLWGAFYCMSYRRQLLAAGPYEFTDDDADYSAAYAPATPRRKPFAAWRSKRARKRAMKEARLERAEQAAIDAILAKVSSRGMQSLTWSEKRVLRKATEKQRERDSRRSMRRV